jgi:predicted phage terminase large subunit-like protein
MALTPAQKEYARQRKANQRAREKGEPEPYGPEFRAEQKVIKATQEERKSEFLRRLEECAALDKSGERYRGEARSRVRLLRLFYGLPEVEEEDGDEETGSGKAAKKSKGPKRPNPSETAIRIQNTNLDPRATRGRRPSAANIDYEIDEVVSFERWLDLRDRARKDLFWLGRSLGKDLFRTVHQQICDQFVRKNFGGPWLNQDGTIDTSRPEAEPAYFEGYTLGDAHAAIKWHHLLGEDGEANPYGREREMMLLDSRGFFKSTIDGIDCVQWLLCCPDIRILIITGEYKLALKFLSEIKQYFHLGEGYEPKTLHLLFPEYVLYGKDGTSETPLECPARLQHLGEPSLWVNSIVANLSGWHCDIKKGDDVVTDENSNNEEQREKLKTKYDGTDDLLDPHGFMDHIGTRYFTDDWYGMRLTPPKDAEEKSEPLKYFCRGCWVIKPEYRDLPLVSLTEDMVTLTFPQRWGFAKLRSLLLKKMSGTNSDRTFRNQQMNEPTDASEDSGFKISFTEDMLRAHMYSSDQSPRLGEVFIVWDWALSDRATSDYSAGVAARLYKNDKNQWSFSILEIVYGKWKHSELAHQIISFSKKWNPKVTMIEQSNGADMLKAEIQNVSYRYAYKPYIWWRVPSRQENAKRNRIKSIEILVTEHRLYFVLGSWIDETIRQFTQYTGEKKNKGRKDDIPDAVSFLTYLLPADARPVIDRVDPEEEKRLQEEHSRKVLRDQMYERYFGGTGGELPKEQPSIETPAPKKLDPRMVIFGNKGPWRL